MDWYRQEDVAKEGDLVELYALKHTRFIFNLKKGDVFQSHRGVFRHDDLIGKPWGSQVQSHLGKSFLLLQPSLSDVLLEIPRVTQVIYPKEVGFILVNMGIGPGKHVLEAGTGSGGLTAALAYSVGAEGHVTSYETRADVQKVAYDNLKRLGLDGRVTLKLRDIRDGFDEKNQDAVFLDVQNPHDYIYQVRDSLRAGGFFGCILPTANQVIRLLPVLREAQFGFIEICEILLRYYKAEAERFRPVDRMVAHTGFLVFSRLVSLPYNDENDSKNPRDIGDESVHQVLE